jgi:hypothetical protein
VSCTPNPPGMTRVPGPGSRPPRWYDIKDGTQVVGQTERIKAAIRSNATTVRFIVIILVLAAVAWFTGTTLL